MGNTLAVLFDENKRNTPEHRLWFQVLATYVLEARNKCKETDRKCRQGKMQIRSDIDHAWTRYICDLVDYDYDTFRRRVLAILGESCPIHGPNANMRSGGVSKPRLWRRDASRD
jgi:hypothetical protein